MNRSQTPIRRTWALLIAGPLLFLVAIVVTSVYFGVVTRGDAQAIAEQTPKAVPAMLVAVQLLLLAFLVAHPSVGTPGLVSHRLASGTGSGVLARGS